MNCSRTWGRRNLRSSLFLKPGPLSLFQPTQVDSVNPGGAQLADVGWFFFSSGPEVLASFVAGDVWPLGMGATPPVELATRTKILQLDGLASSAAPAAISSPEFSGAIVTQEGRSATPRVGWEWIEVFRISAILRLTCGMWYNNSNN